MMMVEHPFVTSFTRFLRWAAENAWHHPSFNRRGGRSADPYRAISVCTRTIIRSCGQKIILCILSPSSQIADQSGPVPSLQATPTLS